MNFQFSIQQYQTDAVDAVALVFSGQGRYERTGDIRDAGARPGKPAMPSLPGLQTGSGLSDPTGYKNADIELTDAQLLANIHDLQTHNNIKLSSALVKELGRCGLDIEMETGTGKTYVYIKTMFELNRRYGWSKFIVVVPSVAIREGVKKSFEITQEHFMEQYGKKARFFVYSSSNLQQLDNFSSSAGLNVMIINTQAFAASMNEEKNVEGRKGDAAARIIYSKRDAFASRRPIDVIAANRPILMLDEPQKMGKEDSATQKALKRFNPLFSVNYSATHATRHNLVYVLDALDAYHKRLVKKIAVKGFEVKNLRGTDRYLFLESIVLSSSKPPKARMEMEVAGKTGLRREIRLLGAGDNLYALSGEMEQYKGMSISEIDPLLHRVTFSNGEHLKIGTVTGDVSEKDLRRIQIRETIVSHFEKEEELFNQRIKTLSLFFIDEVAKYRVYDKDGQETPGEYGKLFEQEYASILNEYRTRPDTPYQHYLRAQGANPQEAHRGYFSIDKKTGRSVDCALKRGSEFSDDISAYDLILKNKERLLSFEEPTRFIFSHSALREGWDNPNVFQICTLKHSGSQTMKRQEVGRGLRLCVNQAGTRMDALACGDTVHDINKLTVIASESYAGFVADLQKDLKAVLYDRPSKASIDYFEGKTVMQDNTPVVLTAQQAKLIHTYLIRNSYIDAEDTVTDTYRDALAGKGLAALPEAVAPMSEGIHTLVQGVFDERVLARMVENDNEPKTSGNPLNDNFYKKEFQTLWGCINHKYAYTVDFSSDELIKKSISSIDANLSVTEPQYTTTTGEQRSDMNEYQLERGESFDTVKTKTQHLQSAAASQIQYDLIGKIAEGTVLTRRTAAAILKGIKPEKFYLFRSNPEECIHKLIRLIKEQKATMIVEHIAYDQIEGTYDNDIFTAQKSRERFARAYRAKKHIQDYVFTDGIAKKNIERKFAEDLDTAGEVCVYAKLPRGFAIPTPVGDYTPGWAIAFKQGAVKHIYFVAETKGTLESLNLRPIEQAKISCARKLFNEISTSKVRYHDVDSYQQLLHIMESLN